MPVNKTFLKWDENVQTKIVSFLKSKFYNNSELRLDKLVLVYSSSRAGRRLQELLAIDAKDNSYILTPPRIITVGSLPELFYQPEIPIANAFEENLAWISALKKFDPEKIRSIAGVAPKEDAFIPWLGIARDIRQMYLEITGACLSFTEAGEKISQMASAPKVDRWWLLADVHRQYLLELAEIGLADREELRRKALENEKLSLTGFEGCEIVLCAVRDMNNITKSILKRADCNITALIHAPESEKDGFDEFGCVVPSYWGKKSINIKSEDVIPALDSVDQGLAALSALEDLKGEYSEKEIAIGYTSSSIFPHLQGAFKEAGFNLHDPGGEPLSYSKPAKLLSLFGKYLNGRKFRSFFELIRFPEVEIYVRGALGLGENVSSLVSGFDDFQMERLQSVTYREPVKLKESEKVIIDTINLINKTAEIFNGEKRPLDFWIGEIHKLLTVFFPNTEDYKDEFDAINDCLNRVTETQRNLLPFISGVDAVSLVVSIFGETSLPKDREASDIDALGWLELQLEDSPVMIITGMNEGLLPETVNADTFLPEGVRKHLWLVDNERRYAREAFVLTSLINSVKYLKFIYAKLDASGSPILPSRLLVNKDNFLSSVEDLYFRSPLVRSLEVSESKASKVNWEMPPKPLKTEKVISKLPVTAFRRYIECPYRFYLEYVLGLKDKDDSVLEMDGRVFGTLAHNVMSEFNSVDGSHTTDKEAILKALNESLNKCFFAQFGSSPLAPVTIQKEQLRKRLELFSSWHAKWRKDGWVTKEVEFKPDEKSLTFNVDGEDFILQARIDRIDYHEASNTYAVFDYKFSEKSEESDKAHLKDDLWIDLQLPLYYHILKNSGINGDIKLGYIRLSPGMVEEDIVSFTEWDADKLQNGLDAAFEIIRKVRSQVFWPPSDKIKYTDKYAVLLGEEQFFEEATDE